MISRWLLPLLVVSAVLVAQPKPIPEVPYDSLMSERVSVDGMLEEVEEGEAPEYPATYADKKTGLKVHWGFDDEFIYVALESRSKGWMAIGFGSPTMDGANIVMGYYTDESTEVFNELGKGYSHAPIPGSDSIMEEWDIDRDDETGVTVMEFVYPLQFPKVAGLAIPGMVAGDTYDAILAVNPRSANSRAKHGQISSFKFRLAEKPLPPPPKDSTPGPKK